MSNPTGGALAAAGNLMTPERDPQVMAIKAVKKLAGLSAIFLKGFKEAIGIAVVLVGVYLALNAVVTAKAVLEVFVHPELLPRWRAALFAQHTNWISMLGVLLLLFPKLALGLSGFETGVAVMPLISGTDARDRVRNTRRLLNTAALIMSVFLLATSMVTTLLIPPAAFAEGGPANGRAMAYLAHQYFGNGFGTIYDVSTILILALAGASAMAGLLNLIPRYLPRLGMAPEWARASRPLVLVFMGIAVVVTLAFHADVDAQGGAYATGVLVLITSAATAVTLSLWRTRMRWIYLCVTVIFVYTTALNVWERPEGLKISSYFILTIIAVSLISRAMRSTELRVSSVEFSAEAAAMLEGSRSEPVLLIARRPKFDVAADLDHVEELVRRVYGLNAGETLYFLEVERTDASDFDQCLKVEGHQVGRHRVLYAKSPVVANAIAALLIRLEQRSGLVPHAYFKWKEGNPIANVFRFLFLGEGDAAPLTHEVLRKAVKNLEKRPIVHVS